MTTETPLDHLCATIRGIAATAKSPLDVGAQVEKLVRATVPLLLERRMKHPPTQPDAQTEQPMHMQNGLTLEQREWIRAEIACALESRPAAPTSKADEMLGRFVRWHDNDGPDDLDEILNAAREHVEAQGKAKAVPTAAELCGIPAHMLKGDGRETAAQMLAADPRPRAAPLPTTGEREVPSYLWQRVPMTESLCEVMCNDGSRVACVDGTGHAMLIVDELNRLAQRAPLSPSFERYVVGVDAAANGQETCVLAGVAPDGTMTVLSERVTIAGEVPPLSPEAKGEGTVDVEAVAKALCEAFRNEVEDAADWEGIGLEAQDGYRAEARRAIEMLTGGAK